MAHQHYALDLCIEAFIVNDGAVLLRMHDKYGIWMGPGGHIDPGEDPNQAVKREAMEEAGLDITLIGPAHWKKEDTKRNQDLVPPMFLNRHRVNEHHEHSCFLFAATSTTRKITPQEGEMDVEFRWVTMTELREMHENDNRLEDEFYRYALTALELAGAKSV